MMFVVNLSWYVSVLYVVYDLCFNFFIFFWVIYVERD